MAHSSASTHTHGSGQQWLAAAVSLREVACGDGRDATRPGAQHLSAWRMRALGQVAGAAAAIDGAQAVAAAELQRAHARPRRKGRLMSGPV
jgi:hypothetical protein